MLELQGPWYYGAAAYFVAFVLGFIVGAIEVAYRYKDAPLSSIRTTPGIGYITLNGFFAVIGLYLIHVFKWNATLDDADTLASMYTQDVLLASFSSMAVMRGAFMNIRNGSGEEIPFGPNLLIERLLQMLDRSIARDRMIARTIDLNDLSKLLSYDQVAFVIFRHCRRVMQNVSEQEWNQIDEFIDLRVDGSMSEDDAKLSILAALYDILGSETLDIVAKNVTQDDTAIEDKAPSEVLQSLKEISRSQDEEDNTLEDDSPTKPNG